MYGPAWLSHQLIGLIKGNAPIFDSIIVVTDRRILDQQIRDTIKQFAQVRAEFQLQLKQAAGNRLDRAWRRAHCGE